MGAQRGGESVISLMVYHNFVHANKLVMFVQSERSINIINIIRIINLLEDAKNDRFKGEWLP